MKNNRVVDYDVNDFAQLLIKLEEHPPITVQYDNNFGQEKDVWWSSQREHMFEWFTKQDSFGEGNYKRNTINKSAMKTYNRLQCAGALLWIAEALGENEELIRNTAIAASREIKNKRAGVVREQIPWENIVKLCEYRLTPLFKQD